MTKALKNTGYWPDINGGPTTVSSAVNDNHMESNSDDPEPQAGPSGLAEKKSVDNPGVELYKKVMKDFQIDTCEFSMSGANRYH